MNAQELTARLAKLNKDYTIAQREAATHHDPDLTVKELQADRAKLTERNRTKYAAELDNIRALAGGIRLDVDSAKKRTPKPEGSTRDGWERAKMLLDAGRPLAQIVKHADAAMLHGIKEWAPTYLDAQRGNETVGDALVGGRGPVDTTGLERSIQKRWAELTGDKALASALAEVPHLAQLDAALSAAELTASGHPGGGLTGALSAHYAGQAAGVDLEAAEADNA